MLVIISDLHLSEGTPVSSLSNGAFELFAERLGELAGAASWRAGDVYRPLERVDLVLLGDVLEISTSQRWLEGDARPWDDPHDPRALETISQIVDGVLWHNREGLKTLRAMAAEGSVSVPAAAQGQPAFDAPWQPVPVRTHYLVGNTDWHLHVRGEGYNLLRQKTAHHLGLANSHTQPFPHDAAESDELLEALRRHRVYARHGDVFDPLNFHEDRDLASLGDALRVEVLHRFARAVANDFADDLPPGLINNLGEMACVRPLPMAPVWLEGLLERACPRPAVRKALKLAWDRLAEALLDSELARDRAARGGANLRDGLAAALQFSRRPSIGWAAQTQTWLQRLRGADRDSYDQHALAEQDFRNRRARHIVYGHTHQPEHVALDASYADDFVLNQMYFNAGSWRRVYQPTRGAPTGREFIPLDSINFLAFYQGDERGGRPFESWSGVLGVNPAPLGVKTREPRAAGPIATQGAGPTATHGAGPRAGEHSPHFGLAAPTRQRRATT